MAYTDIKNKIDLLREQITAHGKLTPDQLKKINYKFRLEWNYNSNSMEGNTLTIEETRSVMVGNIDVHQKPYKDVAEMKGHDAVVADILKIGKGELQLSESRVKQIHEDIMYEEDEDKKAQIGKWKRVNNYIYNYKGERFDFVDFNDVPDKIHDLLNRTNAAIDAIQSGKKNAPHPLDVAFNFHLEYVNIHPFYDGNGRTARILTNLILISLGYPPFWITEPQRAAYSNYLGDIQGYGGDPDLFNNFLGELVLMSQQIITNAIEGKDIEEETDLQKEISLLKRQLEGEKFTKSPKNIYDVYSYCESKIWSSIRELSTQFDEFFSENKTKRFVNSQDEIYKTQSTFPIFQNPFEKSTKPASIKIFGHDVYEKSIDEIKWEHKKYGLKKSMHGEPYEINFTVDFSLTVYHIKLWLNYKMVFDKGYPYNGFIEEDEIKLLTKNLGRELLDNIKRDVN